MTFAAIINEMVSGKIVAKAAVKLISVISVEIGLIEGSESPYEFVCTAVAGGLADGSQIVNDASIPKTNVYLCG